MQPLAKSVSERKNVVSRKGSGSCSKPGGKLAMSRSIVSPTPPSHSTDWLAAETQHGGEISLETRADTSHALAPASRIIHTAPRICESLKESATFIHPSVFNTLPQVSKPTSLNASTSYSFTDSDLISDNSFLKDTFPSLPSSTQTSYSSAPSPILPAITSTRPMVGVDTFISAGAGPHCPLGDSDNRMTDTSLVQRGSRLRLSRTRVSTLRVLGKDHGSEVMAALRMAFKTYEPAVALMKKSLKDPSYDGEGEEIEKFALRLMDDGLVDQADQLCMLSELLHTTQEVLDKVLSREQEVKRLLIGQKVQDFAIDGPVRRRLSEVINAIVKQQEEEEEEEKQRVENEMIAAEFDADSFREENSFQQRQQDGGMARAITVSPAAVRERSLEQGSQVYTSSL